MNRGGAYELLNRCATVGEAEDWEEFVDRYRHRLAAGIRRALRRAGAVVVHEDQEDLLQNVYCRLLEQRGRRLRRCRGDGDQAVGAYLAKIAESVTIDHLRALGAAKRGRNRLVDTRLDGWGDPLTRAVDPRPTPEERLLRQERWQVFLRRCRAVAGARSPGRDLKVLHLAIYEGLSSREISERLGGGLRPTSIDSLIFRLRRRMSRAGVRLPRR
ncbi:MAG: sigma-70 family RNA polymerase sigma factor [Acidobacteria bacterium]|nr:MAG: sigma-70 family RNA polymerase sigma factor [Acidobacteriota bacterium]